MTTPQNIHRINSSYNNNGMQQQLHSATSDKWGQDSVANAVNSPAYNGSSGKQQHSSSVAVDSTRPSAAAAVTMSSIAQQVDEIEKNHASNLNAAEEDLNIFVKQLLEQMQSKFSDMSVKILGKIEEMGSRIDDLENSINVLVDQAGMSDLNSFQHHGNSTTSNNTSVGFQEMNTSSRHG